MITGCPKLYVTPSLVFNKNQSHCFTDPYKPVTYKKYTSFSLFGVVYIFCFISGIFCLEDEVTYWKNILQTSENRSRRDSASTFLEILQPLIKDFR